jgi:hypothetical protein
VGCPRDIIPRHGPGSVATGEESGEKTHFSRIYGTVEMVYPFTEYFHFNLSHTVDALNSNTLNLLELPAGTAKVVLVPKDSRGPRLISSEPLELQWIQQGLQRKLYDIIESHRMTAGRVNFTDQTVNRALALAGSKTGTWVTLDMKDASDRVSRQLVRRLFPDNWFEAMDACRSTGTRLPNGQFVELEKFAPMGSAVCFPVEALTFFALAVSTLRILKGYSRAKALASVFVYGDDIICRVEDYDSVMHRFPLYGLMFNEGKCCVSGSFRESCGCDAFRGVDVTPIRLKKTWCPHSSDVQELASYVAHGNALYAAGYRRSFHTIRQLVENRYGPLPVMDPSLADPSPKKDSTAASGIISWRLSDVIPQTYNSGLGFRSRFGPTHKYEVYGYSVRPKYKQWKVRGWEAMLRSRCCGSTGMPPGMYAVAHRSRLTRTWGS